MPAYASASATAVRPGQHRETVTVAREVRTADATTAEEAITWTDQGTGNAAVVPLTAEQARRAGAPEASQPHRFIVRDLGVWASLTVGDRLTWGGLTLFVRSITDAAARGRALDILATAT